MKRELLNIHRIALASVLMGVSITGFAVGPSQAFATDCRSISFTWDKSQNTQRDNADYSFGVDPNYTAFEINAKDNYIISVTTHTAKGVTKTYGTRDTVSGAGKYIYKSITNDTYSRISASLNSCKSPTGTPSSSPAPSPAPKPSASASASPKASARPKPVATTTSPKPSAAASPKKIYHPVTAAPKVGTTQPSSTLHTVSPTAVPATKAPSVEPTLTIGESAIPEPDVTTPQANPTIKAEKKSSIAKAPVLVGGFVLLVFLSIATVVIRKRKIRIQ